MTEADWKSVSIRKKLWVRLGDHHRHGSRPHLLEEAFDYYEAHVLNRRPGGDGE